MEKEVEKIRKFAEMMVTPERMKHVEGTVRFARSLCVIHNLDKSKAEFMAYAHDLFRDVNFEKLLKIAKIYLINISFYEKLNPILLHGKIAAEFVRRRFNIEDDDVLTGIAFHTSGYKNFGIYGKVLFLADSLEETRTYPKVEMLRELAYKDIDMAFYEVMRNKIIYALSRDLLILPESVEVWNSMIIERKGGVV
ncbi:MAG: bis(5'-nucleosyl)-tetraphosphatase (symmetrical) YqeK [Thermosipho sp. (in: Bacteria)]|nr:bis(5'-nucleosyl)-tetraphosphatase (symmetrical) YqeK [Thermosipho sp. (in: thermotogales)]